MNSTEKVRSFLSMWEGEFCMDDLKGYKSVSAILGKMHETGEIAHVGFRHRGANGGTKPLKVYRVVKLRMPKAKLSADASAEADARCVALWKKVYPDLFKMPDFSGYKCTVRGNVICG